MQFATKHPVRVGILALLREHQLGHRLDPGALDRSPFKGGFQSAALVFQSVDRQIDRYALPVELQHRHGARLVADEVTLIENIVRDIAVQEKSSTDLLSSVNSCKSMSLYRPAGALSTPPAR